MTGPGLLDRSKSLLSWQLFVPKVSFRFAVIEHTPLGIDFSLSLLNIMELGRYIDTKSSEILNAKGTLGDVFNVSGENDGDKALAGVASDCDPQILITLQFKEPIKLASIKFVSATACTLSFCVCA